MKHLSLFVAALLGFTATGLAQYSMTVESAPAAQVADQTVYRFYVDMPTDSCEVSAVFGDQASPLIIDAPAGVYNSGFNATWSASGINPAFLALAPDMIDDTYATIGLEGPSSTSVWLRHKIRRSQKTQTSLFRRSF